MTDKRALVWLKPRFLGDAVCATPLLATLESHGWSGSLFVSGRLEELLVGVAPGFSRAQLPDPAKPRGFLQAVRELRHSKFEAVMLVNRSFRSALVARFAGVPIRIGHGTEGRAPLLTHSVAYDEDRSEIESYLDLARRVDLATVRSQPYLIVSEAERARGKELAHGAVLGIQPGATHGRKALPPAVVDAVLRFAAQRDLPTVLLGHDAPGFAEALSEPASLNLMGQTTLRETLGILSSLETFVAGDTGLVHMAAALGVPTLAAFGYEKRSKWGYHDPPHFSVQLPQPHLEALAPGPYLAVLESRWPT